MPEFKTICEPGQFKETRKRSKFLSFAFPVNSEEEVNFRLKKLKSEFYDAKHIVYAYKLYNPDIQKFSDDGEPSGTGGIPVINAIKSFDLNNILVAVVRYFGGILLGTSGLREMYSSGAQGAILNSQIESVEKCIRSIVVTDYGNYGKVLKVLSDKNAKIFFTDYAEKVSIDFCVAEINFNEVQKKINTIMQGKEIIKFVENTFIPLK
ncbi:MAG: IMPACT family protein [Acutalibacteraceae bacterium]